MLRGIRKLFRPKTGRNLLIDRFPVNSVGAEIGVWKGDFSKLVVAAKAPRKYYLIDPWAFQPRYEKRWYGGAQAKAQTDMDEIHESVVQLFANEESVHVMRETSAAAAEKIEDGSLDWVYIDGDHSYDAVLQDLRLYSKKVKRGGALTGDDFSWQDSDGSFPVRRAVIDFMDDNELKKIDVFSGQFILEI